MLARDDFANSGAVKASREQSRSQDCSKWQETIENGEVVAVAANATKGRVESNEEALKEFAAQFPEYLLDIPMPYRMYAFLYCTPEGSACKA